MGKMGQIRFKVQKRIDSLLIVDQEKFRKPSSYVGGGRKKLSIVIFKQRQKS